MNIKSIHSIRYYKNVYTFHLDAMSQTLAAKWPHRYLQSATCQWPNGLPPSLDGVVKVIACLRRCVTNYTQQSHCRSKCHARERLRLPVLPSCTRAEVSTYFDFMLDRLGGHSLLWAPDCFWAKSSLKQLFSEPLSYVVEVVSWKATHWYVCVYFVKLPSKLPVA